jgi:hypothetical protein
LLSEPGQRCRNVVDPISDVVNPFPALGQEAPHRGVRAQGSEQLDVRRPGPEQDLLHALVLDGLSVGRVDPERPPVEVDRGLEVVRGDTDVVDVLERGSTSCSWEESVR